MQYSAAMTKSNLEAFGALMKQVLLVVILVLILISIPPRRSSLTIMSRSSWYVRYDHGSDQS